jgi:hypothetical protein
MELNSDKQDKILPALIEARKQITGVVKNEKNPHWGNAYAKLPDVINCVTNDLLEHEILLSQPTLVIDGKPILVTELMHISGQWKRGYLPIINKKQDDQGQGSSISFVRRYGILAILNIPAFDDDGELAMALGSGAEAEDVSVESPPTASPSVTDVALQAAKDALGDQKIPAIGRKKEPLINKKQRESFVTLCAKEGVAQTKAVELLKKHDYSKTSDIPVARFEFMKSQIKAIGQNLRVGGTQ